MRTNILTRRLSALSKATSLIALATLAAACSNDVMRLDQMTTASVNGTSNQSRIIERQPQGLSTFETEFDSQQPQVRVVPRDPRTGRVAVNPPPTAAELAAANAPVYSSGVSRNSLPPVQATPTVQAPTPAVPNGPIVLQPRSTVDDALRMANADQLTTASVARVAPQPMQQPAGWDSAKGSWVTVRSSETLYNLSRRYGVPVSAIMSANNIVDGNSVEAGSKILIPTYNYSNTAPISAPDSDPITNASRASRGFQGQVRGRIAVPTARVNDVLPTTPPNIQPTAEQKLATADGAYIVKAGDTLSGIAYRTGASVAAIRAANSMESDTVRLGQKLKIPSYGTTTASIKNAAGVDTTLTGSIPTPTVKPTRVKPVLPVDNQTVASIAPSKPTNSSQAASSTCFRWPAEGRVISKFGQRSATGVNDGIDISMPVGTPVKASQSGTVIYAGSELEDFGNLILVSHAGGWVSAYAHSSANLVRRGEKVKRGQVIAKSGRSGNAKVPKLHFELRKNSNPVNPMDHLAR